jgi:hypothetical protein
MKLVPLCGTLVSGDGDFVADDQEEHTANKKVCKCAQSSTDGIKDPTRTIAVVWTYLLPCRSEQFEC